jgi:hypothetical protein
MGRLLRHAWQPVAALTPQITGTSLFAKPGEPSRNGPFASANEFEAQGDRDRDDEAKPNGPLLQERRPHARQG